MVLRSVLRLANCEFAFESGAAVPNLLRTGFGVAGQDVGLMMPTGVRGEQAEPIEMPLAA